MNRHHRRHHEQHHDQLERAPFVRHEGVDIQILNGARQPHHNAGEDDERHAVAHTALADLLAQPHDERRSRWSAT